MELYFYKAKNGTIWDKLIAWWTKSEYSHVELRLAGEMFFSASSREGHVRVKTFNPIHEHWDVVKIPEYAVDAKRMRETIGKKYDWMGILAYEFIPMRIQHNDKWWCSEVVGYAIGLEDYRLSPQELYEIVQKSY